ncbi:hypothetical protein C491_04505 [Natronococcus amylolyticus DSM 10524]|uniref:Uncharacterized protein n=1 Tax=Natronococcus amylolyticus DSM 10524 TaxID=1227497 RepID=L9XFN5_9EURY|nr:hypothetical protein C491_04505 [Natronococcus amylolyticus DSM 10524]
MVDLERGSEIVERRSGEFVFERGLALVDRYCVVGNPLEPLYVAVSTLGSFSGDAAGHRHSADIGDRSHQPSPVHILHSVRYVMGFASSWPRAETAPGFTVPAFGTAPPGFLEPSERCHRMAG